MQQVSERWLGAAFFLPVSDQDLRDWLVSQLRAAVADPNNIGESVLGPEYPGVPVQWGGLCCEATAHQFDQHRVLIVEFLQSDLLQMLQAAGDDPEPAERLAADFRLACERLRPGIALLIRELWPNFVEYVASLEPFVSDGDIDTLLRIRPGLMYIDSPSDEYTAPWSFFDRDMQMTEHGVLIFAGSGSNRWE